MSIVTYCETCDAKQPKDWKSGDLCTSCGAGVREEQRCSWCVKLTPKGKFCKHCGNEVQTDKYFGAARILKNLGISQLELTAKLQELPPAKLEQYQRQYNRHYTIVERALQDTKRLENMLVIKGQEKFNHVEEALLQRIPFDDNFLQKAEDYCATTIEADEKFLEKREKLQSPIARQLADIACLRWLPKRTWTGLHSTSQLIMDNVLSKYSPHKAEFALLLGHINSFDPAFDWIPFQNNISKNLEKGHEFIDGLVDVLTHLFDVSYLKPYAAVALVHSMRKLGKTDHKAYPQFEHFASEALDHPDPSLRLSASLLFAKEELISFIAQKESPVGAWAVRWLLDNNSSHLEKMVTGNTLTTTQFQVVENCLNEINTGYWEEFHVWKAQFKRVAERTREQRAQFLQKEHTKEALEQFEQKVVQDKDKLLQNKPTAPSYHESFVTLSPYVLNQLLDKRAFEETIEENQHDEVSYNRKLYFVGQFGSLSQGDLDTLVENIGYYQRQDAFKSLFSNVPTAGLDYSEAEKLYFSKTDAFANFEKGFELLADWTVIMDSGYCPPVRALESALLFIKVHHGLVAFQDDRARGILLNALEGFLDAPNEISYQAAKFVIEQVLDISNFMLSEWYADMALRRNFCNGGHYFTANNEQVFKFQLDDNFINHFFSGSYEQFMRSYNRILVLHKQATLFEGWISRKPDALASFLASHPEVALSSLKSLKAAVLHSREGILNIKTQDGYYPFIEALGYKEWDMGDVILYSRRTAELFYDQPEACLQRLTDWMTADDGKNFYSPNFDKYVRHFFTFSVKTERIPLGMLKLWLQQAKASSLTKEKSIFYDNFSGLVPLAYNTDLPRVLLKGKSFPLTSACIIENTFDGFDNLLEYVHVNFSYSLLPLTNRFCLHVLYHAKDELIDYCEGEQEKLRKLMYALVALARHPNNERAHNERWLDAVVDTLLALEGGLENKSELINNVWSLSGLHFTITEKVSNYVKKSINTLIQNDSHKGIKVVYAYFEDYFYSKGSDVKWVEDVLDDSMKEIAAGLEANTSLLLEIGNYVLGFLSKEQLIPVGESDSKRILSKLSKHFLEMLEEIPAEKIPQEFIDAAYKKLYSKEIDGITFMKWESFLEDNDFVYTEENPKLTNGNSETEAEAQNQQAGAVVKLEIPEEINYDSEEIHMELAQISMMMSSFKLDQEQMTILINHLPYYKKDKTDNPMLHSLLLMKQSDIINFLKEDMTLAIHLYQKLFEILIDPLCAPDGPFPSYGQMSALVLPAFLEGSIFAQQYVSSIETMVGMGAYSSPHTDMLNNLLDQMKSQQES